jgi:hypothetical protein
MPLHRDVVDDAGHALDAGDEPFDRHAFAVGPDRAAQGDPILRYPHAGALTLQRGVGETRLQRSLGDRLVRPVSLQWEMDLEPWRNDTGLHRLAVGLCMEN